MSATTLNLQWHRTPATYHAHDGLTLFEVRRGEEWWRLAVDGVHVSEHASLREAKDAAVRISKRYR